MILWADNLCWAQLYGSAGLTHVFAVGCQSNRTSMKRTPESRRERDSQHLSINCSSPNGANRIHWRWLNSTPQKGRQREERCPEEICWPSSSLSRTVFSPSSIPYSRVLHSLLWKVLFCLSVCTAWWLSPSTSLPPTFTVILLNLFFNPYSDPKEYLFPFPSSPASLPPGSSSMFRLLFPMLFVIKKTLHCFERKQWCLSVEHLHERKERKTRQKRACFTNFSYSWKSLEICPSLSLYWGSGKTAFCCHCCHFRFSPVNFIAGKATVKFCTVFCYKCSVF